MNLLRRLVSSSAPSACEHVPNDPARPQADRCQECGSTFNLRLCATCGHVGCCESQRGDARSHARAAGHPVIYEMPAESGFIWCYAEGRYVG
jgi:CPA2 family monovalent cation:H+ antiporter-2